jgi:hypothetical protein
MWKDCANADLLLRMLYYRVKAIDEEIAQCAEHYETVHPI